MEETIEANPLFEKFLNSIGGLGILMNFIIRFLSSF